MGIHQTHLTELAQCDGVYRFLFGHDVLICASLDFNLQRVPNLL
jgi:hypothetical protein